VEASLV